MRSRFFIPVTIGLSIAAIGVGRRCAEGAFHHEGRRPVLDRSRTSDDFAAPTADENKTLYQARLGLVARSETDALWQYLIQENGHATYSREIYTELLDRLGRKALEFAFTLPEGEMRTRIATGLFEKLMERDLDSAVDLFVGHREGLPPSERSILQTEMIRSSQAVSAEAMIATCELLKSPTDMIWSPFDPHFAPGFDSRKALDYVAGDKAVWELEPDLVRNWAKTQPVEAARWLLAHPDLSRVDQGGPMDAAGSNVVAVVAAIASSPAEGRSEAFAALMKLPEEIRQSTWESFPGSQSRPEMLEAATAMGVRDKYLQQAFLTTRTDNVNPAFWTQVSADEQEALLSAEQQRWMTGESHTPVLETIHTAWLERVRKQWAAADPH